MKLRNEQKVRLWLVFSLVFLWGAVDVNMVCQTAKTSAPAQTAGQGKPAAAPSPAQPAPVALSEDEAKDVEINALKMQMLDMQIRDAETKMWQARQQIQKDLDDLTNRLAKAHSVDLSAYRLDSQAKAFVPKATPAAGPKPATADGKQKTGDGKRETGNGEN